MNPDEIPEDADRTTLVGYIGEDLARIFVRRVAALVALLALAGGLLVEEADPVLRTAAAVAGGSGASALLLAMLFGMRRTRQWLLLLGVLGICAALFAALMVQVRAAA